MLLLIRTLVAGLIGGCLVLALGFQPRMVIVRQVVSRPRVHVPAGATLIDVSGSVTPAAMLSLIKLGRSEHVVTVDDAKVDNDLSAGVAIADNAHGRDTFVDVGVEGQSGPRRVLLLIH